MFQLLFILKFVFTGLARFERNWLLLYFGDLNSEGVHDYFELFYFPPKFPNFKNRYAKLSSFILIFSNFSFIFKMYISSKLSVFQNFHFFFKIVFFSKVSFFQNFLFFKIYIFSKFSFFQNLHLFKIFIFVF